MIAGPQLEEAQEDWRPMVLHGWSGFAILLFLFILIAGIAVLFIESRRSALYQTAFVYQKSISFGNGITANLTPYSIIPTLIAVIVKLWWGALEGTFKKLQPYIMMARQPTKASRGLTLSYIDSVMLWASWKAATKSHWLLALISLGTFTTEICKSFDRGEK
jgi:hypothetical protein